MFLDNGRKTIFTAAVGANTGERRIRWYSTKECHPLTRSIQFLKRQKKSKYEKDVTKVETDIPTLKTSISNDYTIYINQDLNHMKILSKFYAFKTAKDIFHLYQVRQIVPEEMVNMLVHNGIKYDKKKDKG